MRATMNEIAYGRLRNAHATRKLGLRQAKLLTPLINSITNAHKRLVL